MRHIISVLLLAIAPVSATFAASQERSLPIFFLPNAGQTDPSIRYVAQTREMFAGFADDSAVFQIHGIQIRVHFAGANPSVSIEGANELAARANFLIGDDPAAWHTSLPTYR